MSQEIFTEIMRTNHWGGAESVSGIGSDSSQTAFLIPELESLLQRYHITSMLDIPCGDFNWMRKVSFDGDYIGADIVPTLVEVNRLKYQSKNRRFEVLDITADTLPVVDLIFTRDCLVHLSVSEVFDALENIKASGATYLLATTYFWQAKEFNHDIDTGGWRRLNLHQPPFNLPFPQEVLIEGYMWDDNKDKSLALWKIDDITIERGK